MNKGFFITVPVATFMALFTLIGTQGMHGDESVADMFIAYGVIWFVLFGFAGLVPKLFTRAERKSALASLISFGIGGAVSGTFFPFILTSMNLGGSLISGILVLVLLLFLPWLIGAGLFYLFRYAKSRYV